jgi:hypothetical protein
MNVLLSINQYYQQFYDSITSNVAPITPSETNPQSTSQGSAVSTNNGAVDQSQVAIAKALNSYNKSTVGFRGKPSDASSSCVQATLDSAEHAQKLLGTDSSKIIGNNIGNIANKELTGKFQGQSMKAIKEAFLRGEIKVGDTLSLGSDGALKNVGGAQNSGQGHHALTVTYLCDNQGNLILENGKPQIGFIDNTAGKQTISWNDFESRYSKQFPKILEIGRPTYGKASSPTLLASG